MVDVYSGENLEIPKERSWKEESKSTEEVDSLDTIENVQSE